MGCVSIRVIKKTFGKKPSNSWHVQVSQLLFGFSRKIKDFPKVGYKKTNELRKLRNPVHYDILAQVTVKTVMGLEPFFKYLPLVVNVINSAISLINRVYQSTLLKRIKSRFKNLHLNLPKIYKVYNKNYPENEIAEFLF